MQRRPYIYVTVKFFDGYTISYPVFSRNMESSSRRYNPKLWFNIVDTTNIANLLANSYVLIMNLTMLGHDNIVADRLARFLAIAIVLRQLLWYKNTRWL